MPESLYTCIKSKGKGRPMFIGRAYGLEIINPAVGCHNFLSDLRWPSQPWCITAHRPVTKYTAWWQMHMSVNNLPTANVQRCLACSWTLNLLIAMLYLLHHQANCIHEYQSRYQSRGSAPCGWGVKAGMVHVCVAGKTVRSYCYTWTISEHFRYKGLIIKCYINSSVYFTYLLHMPIMNNFKDCSITPRPHIPATLARQSDGCVPIRSFIHQQHWW